MQSRNQELSLIAEGGRVDAVSLGDDSRFWAFAAAMKKGRVPADFERPLLSLDPGETTGVCVWCPAEKKLFLFQLATKDVAEGYVLVERLLQNRRFVHVRCEDYRVYGHMTEQHSFAHLHTAQFIGAIKVAVYKAGVDMSVCLAMHAKTVWTDDKLKMCDLYNKGMKHARDAERHMLRYMCE